MLILRLRSSLCVRKLPSFSLGKCTEHPPRPKKGNLQTPRTEQQIVERGRVIVRPRSIKIKPVNPQITILQPGQMH